MSGPVRARSNPLGRGVGHTPSTTAAAYEFDEGADPADRESGRPAVGACSSQPPAPAKTVTETVTVATPGPPPSSAQPGTTNAAPAVGMGQEARDGGFVFTVTEVRPLAGEMTGKGVAVLFTVKNVGH